MTLKIDESVITLHGRGIVADIETFRTCRRVGVILDNNPFPWPISYYFENEVKPTENEHLQ